MEQYSNGLNPHTWTARFHDACSTNNLQQAQSLVDELRRSNSNIVKEIDRPDIDLYTPLHRACENGHVEVVKYLIGLGADPDVSHPGLDGWTPLHISVW